MIFICNTWCLLALTIWRVLKQKFYPCTKTISFLVSLFPPLGQPWTSNEQSNIVEMLQANKRGWMVHSFLFLIFLWMLEPIFCNYRAVFDHLMRLNESILVVSSFDKKKIEWTFHFWHQNVDNFLQQSTTLGVYQIIDAHRKFHREAIITNCLAHVFLHLHDQTVFLLPCPLWTVNVGTMNPLIINHEKNLTAKTLSEPPSTTRSVDARIRHFCACHENFHMVYRWYSNYMSD